jgi:hypothetical protein
MLFRLQGSDAGSLVSAALLKEGICQSKQPDLDIGACGFGKMDTE